MSPMIRATTSRATANTELQMVQAVSVHLRCSSG